MRLWRRFPASSIGRTFSSTQHLRHTISNTVYNEFLITERDYHKEILEEAVRKHPLNPRDVPAQKPGEDKAPIPVPSGNIVSAEVAKRHAQRTQQPTPPPSPKPVEPTPPVPPAKGQTVAQTQEPTVTHPRTPSAQPEPPKPSNPVSTPTAANPEPSPPKSVPKPSAKPAAMINSNRAAEIQQQANATDDKKHVCSLCGKSFRLLLALEHHMTTKHGATAPPTPATTTSTTTTTTIPTPQSTASAPVSKTPPPKINIQSEPVQQEEPVSPATASTAAASSYDRTATKELQNTLLALWDTIGEEKLGAQFVKSKHYTPEEVKKYAESIRGSVRDASESGTVDDTPPIQPIATPVSINTTQQNSANIAPPNTYPPEGNPNVIQVNPFANLSTTAPPGSGAFNPFEAMANISTAMFDSSLPVAPGGNATSTTEATGLSSELSQTDEKRFQCSICGKAFKTQVGLSGHYEAKHPGQAVGTATSVAGKHAINVNLENIPAYVPTPVDMSKIPGQGTSEADPKAALLAEELKNATVTLEQDIVVHARSYTNITVSGVVCDITTGYSGLIPVTQFGIIVDNGDSEPETIIVRAYGSSLAKKMQSSLADGQIVLVLGLLRLNPVPLGNRCYHNPYVTVSDATGTIVPLL
eukprot:PhF_6_TR15472/c0_g1_i1/m.24061